MIRLIGQKVRCRMIEYKVEIKETLSRIVPIVAESEDNALGMVETWYRDQGIVLDASDFQDVEFEVI